MGHKLQNRTQMCPSSSWISNCGALFKTPHPLASGSATSTVYDYSCWPLRSSCTTHLPGVDSTGCAINTENASGASNECILLLILNDVIIQHNITNNLGDAMQVGALPGTLRLSTCASLAPHSGRHPRSRHSQGTNHIFAAVAAQVLAAATASTAMNTSLVRFSSGVQGGS